MTSEKEGEGMARVPGQPKSGGRPTAMVTMGIAIAALAASCANVPTDQPVENNVDGSAFELISRTRAPTLSPLTTIELWRARSGGACFAVFASGSGLAVSQALECSTVGEAK